MLSVIKRILSRRGHSRTYDDETFAVMDRILQPDSVCVDVGAHAGDVLAEMLRRAPRGRHFAFEPLPECFAVLKRRFAGRDNVTLHPFALAETAGTTTFQHVVSRPTFSGLRRRRYESPDEKVVEIRVEQARLDDVLPTDARVDFMKIDVEGGEYGVLRGAMGVLGRSRPVVVFEHGLGAADFYGVEPEQVYDLIVDACGLELSLMERFLAGAPPLTRAEHADEFRTNRNYYFIAYPR